MKTKTNSFLKNKLLLILVISLSGKMTNAQTGTWTQVTAHAPHSNWGGMLLLTDGSVITVANSTVNGGNRWDKLTPDSHGSYVNGTWSAIAPMHYHRYPFASQVLQDGRVYVAGSEYYTGQNSCEIYNPQTNTWTVVPNPLNYRFGENNSMLLPNGKVLQGLGNQDYPTNCVIFDPTTNLFTPTDSTHLGYTVEATWGLLPDHSILMVDYYSTDVERYIPSLNRWIPDAPVPANLDLYGNSVEIGAGIMLPDGRLFFIGASSHTAYYSPSGDTTMGTWQAGPEIPDSSGALDAPAAMILNGKILFAASPLPSDANGYYPFNEPTRFYEFDYITNSIARTTAPGGLDSLDQTCQLSHFLNLPDGTILYSQVFTPTSSTYYVYTPVGLPNNSWKPTIDANGVTQTNCYDFNITGTLFNGISQGSAFGDDWQMSTNYPIVRLTSGINVYYAKTHNWNNTGLQTGTLPTSTQFTVPITLPSGTYSLQVIANGIASDPYPFIYPVVPPSGNIIGPSVVCGLTNTTYSVATVAGATSYNWTVPTGATGMTIVSGQGTTSINVNISAGTVIGTVTCVVSNGCGTIQSSTLAVTKKPMPPTTITGPPSICGLTSATFSIPVLAGATSYQWSTPAGVTIATGQGTTQITVTIAPTFVNGTITVAAVNACGSSQGTTLTIIGNVPATPGTLSGPANVCGIASSNFSISPVAGATSYVWTIVGGGNTINGSNSGLSVNANLSGAGSIACAAINTCGTGTARTLVLSTAAIQPAAISGVSSTCGLTSTIFTVPSLGVNYSYNWQLPAGMTLSAGGGTNTIVVTIASSQGNTTVTGILKVSATNSCGNTSAFRTMTVTRCL